MGCHTPHGSQNARMLNMPNINALCNQCHSPVAAGTVHGMNAGSSELTPCTSCHTLIMDRTSIRLSSNERQDRALAPMGTRSGSGPGFDVATLL